MKQNLLNFKLSTLEKESWTSEAMVQHSSILNICIVWPAGRTNVIWIKCKHTITYFSSHPHSKQYNTYAKSMPAVGGQTLNDWTRTAETAEWAYTVSVLCFAFEQFFLLPSTQKLDLPFCGAAAWGTLFITSDSGHIISKLLLFSIYWDDHLRREEIPSPKAHSVSVFLLRLLTRGNYNQFWQCLLCYRSPSTGKWSESKQQLFENRQFSESNFIPRSTWPFPDISSILFLYKKLWCRFVQFLRVSFCSTCPLFIRLKAKST